MLDGKRIAILVEEGFRDSELIEPMRAMKEVEARVVLVGANPGKNYRNKSGKRTITAEITAEKVKVDGFDAIIIPGGDIPDKMLLHSAIIDLVKKLHDLGKVVAVIGYGPRLLILADIVRGRRLTSSPLIAVDLRNAGADWIDEPVVQDGNIISSRHTADLPFFDWTIIEAVRANGQSPGTSRP